MVLPVQPAITAPPVLQAQPAQQGQAAMMALPALPAPVVVRNGAPQAQPVTFTGTGTINYYVKWLDNTGGLTDALVYDNGTSVGIGTTTPAAYLSIGAASQYQVDATGDFIAAGTGAVNGGTLSLGNATSNVIAYNGAGVAAPAFSTTSAGTKIILNPSEDANDVNYSIGIATNTLWYAVPQASNVYQHSLMAAQPVNAFKGRWYFSDDK